MAMRRVWITSDVLRTGLVHEVDAHVEGGIATCVLQGIERMFSGNQQWAWNEAMARAQVRNKVELRLASLERQRAKLEGILAGLGRGELPGVERG